MKKLSIIFRKLVRFPECYVLTVKSLFQIRLYIFEQTFLKDNSFCFLFNNRRIATMATTIAAIHEPKMSNRAIFIICYKFGYLRA